MHWIAPSEKDAASDALEKRLWDAADNFRANSGLTAQQYSGPILGLIFLRFAEARFVARRTALEKSASKAGSGRRGSRFRLGKRPEWRTLMCGLRSTKAIGCKNERVRNMHSIRLQPVRRITWVLAWVASAAAAALNVTFIKDQEFPVDDRFNRAKSNWLYWYRNWRCFF